MTPWIKVFRDLWNNCTRTILVILSIAVGVFAIGMIASTRQALTTSLAAQYAGLLPADAILQTEPFLDDDFVAGIRHMRGVEETEGRRSLPLRISLDGNGETWRDITLYALSDYAEQRLFLVRPQDGAWPPQKGEVLLERASMAYLGVEPGEEILVKTLEGRKFHLLVAGRAYDLYRIPPLIEGWVYGYINTDTLRWMGEPEGYNELYISSSNKDRAAVRAIADRAARRIEGLDLPVYQKTLPDPGQHPLNFIIDTVLLLLGLLALLSMLLSSLLVINVISALVVQQERQIGIMKAIGGRSLQLISMYTGLVLVLGLLACLVAIPFSHLGARVLAAFVADLVNFNPPQVELTPQALQLQFGVGLLVPLLVAAPSILSGTRVSPARALSEYGINQVWRGAGAVDRIMGCFPRLTRDILLAVRNPFRKRGRLILSLATLTFAGAVFIGIVNLQASLGKALNEMLAFWAYDAWLVVEGHVPAARLVSEARAVPGVEQAEAWCFTIGRYIRPDGTESDSLYLLAPPAGTELLNPPIIAGRALRPGDTDAILVTPGLLAREPDLQLGGRMLVKIEGREQAYTIVGVMNMMSNSSIGYFTLLDYSTYTRHVHEPNRANAVILTFTPGELDAQRRLSSQVEQRYDRANLRVRSNFLISEERQEIDGAFSILVALLMVMTIVLATVGGLGLMGTMSLNVIERTREIGVMRAFGASSIAVFRTVIIEGLLIGMMSWVAAIVLSLPISVVLARSVGLSFMDYPMPVAFSLGGVLAWAMLVVLISFIASMLPALRAVRLTVTQVLAYE